MRQEHNNDGTLKPDGSLASKYTKPTDGIPAADLDDSTQTVLTDAQATKTHVDAIEQPGWVTRDRLAVVVAKELATLRSLARSIPSSTQFADDFERADTTGSASPTNNGLGNGWSITGAGYLSARIERGAFVGDGTVYAYRQLPFTPARLSALVAWPDGASRVVTLIASPDSSLFFNAVHVVFGPTVGYLQKRVNNASMPLGTLPLTIPTDGSLHEVAWELVGTTVVASVDGVEVGRATDAQLPSLMGPYTTWEILTGTGPAPRIELAQALAREPVEIPVQGAGSRAVSQRLYDDFERSDQTGLGTAPTGQTYAYHNGEQAKIVSGRYEPILPLSGGLYPVVDLAVPPTRMHYQVSFLGSYGPMSGIVFICANNNARQPNATYSTMLHIPVAVGSWAIQYYTNSTPTDVAVGNYFAVPGATIKDTTPGSPTLNKYILKTDGATVYDVSCDFDWEHSAVRLRVLHGMNTIMDRTVVHPAIVQIGGRYTVWQISKGVYTPAQDVVPRVELMEAFVPIP